VEVDVAQVLADRLGAPGARAATPHLQVGVYLLTLDSPIPVLAAVGFDRSRSERAFLGGTGAAATRHEALAQALFELGQCQTGFHFEDPFGRLPIYADSDLSEVVEFFDAPLYYGYARNLPKTYWFAAGDRRVPWADAGNDVADAVADQRIRRWLGEAGMRPVLLDFDDVCPPGMAITKVFVPGLTHACPPGNPMLGHPRFRTLPRRLGLADHDLTYAGLNPDPIPFA
jgi:ribosomal protein S12 methylthiotransferase accessory factor